MAEEMISIDALTEEASRALTDIEREQFPFALAKTLTEIALGATMKVRTITRGQFRLASDFIPGGVMRTPARKSDIKTKGIGETVVFTSHKISGFMPDHEEGATRRPVSASSARASGGKDKGKAFAIPGEDLITKSYKTSQGAVRTRWHPRTLLKSYHGRTAPKKGTGKKPFITHLKSGAVVIAKRRSKKRLPIDVLYVFTKSAKIRAVWGFEPAVRTYVKWNFNQRFNENLAEAVRNAK